MDIRVGDRVQSALDGLVPAGTEGLVETLGPGTAVTVRLDNGSLGSADLSHLRCRRCLQPGVGLCEVPHPAAFREELGASFGMGRSEKQYRCGACGQHYSSVTEEGVTRLEGAKWCFRGRHVAAELREEDRRRVPEPGTELEMSEEDEGSLRQMQRRLDALPAAQPRLRKLLLEGSCSGEGKGLRFNVRLPELRVLQIFDAELKKIVLTEETTPKLEELRLRNVPGDCSFQVRLAGIKRMSLHHVEQEDGVVNAMLAAATALEEFESYKLWGVSHLRFAGNALRVVHVHRSDCLESISVYAPRLTRLHLGAAYDLKKVKILEDHALRAALPAGLAPSRFSVNLVNSCASRRLVQQLRAHPRVLRVEGPDDDAPAGMGPMESFWRGARGAMNEEDEGDEEGDEEGEEEMLEESEEEKTMAPDSDVSRSASEQEELPAEELLRAAEAKKAEGNAALKEGRAYDAAAAYRRALAGLRRAEAPALELSCRLNLAQAYLSLARERGGCQKAAGQAARAAERVLALEEAQLAKRAKTAEDLPKQWREKAHYRRVEALKMLGLREALAASEEALAALPEAPSLAQQHGEIQQALTAQARRERALCARMFR